MKFTFTKIGQTLSSVFSNLQLSIILLLQIAVASSLGTVLEQDKTQAFYETHYGKDNPVFGFINSELIIYFGLDHIYTTVWFFLLILLFGTSLIVCTMKRQIPSLKLAKLWQFVKHENYKRKNGIIIKLRKTSLSRLCYSLRRRNYNLTQQGEYIYAYKGVTGKMSPILVHIGIVLVLMGSITGSLLGFVVQELIPKGDLFHPQNIVFSGSLSYIVQDFEVYVRDFKIAYTDQGSIDQFYSDLIILDDNLNTKLRKTIFVNEPLQYKTIVFYQTDWQICRIQTQTDKKIIENIFQNLDTKNNSKLWVSPLPSDENVNILLQDLTGKYLMYSLEKKFLGMGSVGSKIYLNGSQTRIMKIIPSTGLQIKSDPGVGIVYLGFLVLIPSTILSYTSYSQIWGIKKQQSVYIHANTNRAVYFFEKSVLEIIAALNVD